MGHRQGNPYTLWIILTTEWIQTFKNWNKFHTFLPNTKNGPILKLENTEIPTVEQWKFLSIIFDLSFIPPYKKKFKNQIQKRHTTTPSSSQYKKNTKIIQISSEIKAGLCLFYLWFSMKIILKQQNAITH